MSRRLAAPVLAFALALGGCGESPTGPEPDASPHRRGITLVEWTATGYGLETTRAQLEEIAALGAGEVVFLVTAYQDHATSPVPETDDPRTPLSEPLSRAVGWARDLGLATGLKIHVDVRDGTWRGLIEPPDPAAWFEGYSGFVLPWAEFAAREGMGLLVAGTELRSLVDEDTRWRDLFRSVRERFPGTLVYAANWDDASRVPFWDAVDRVGVNAYFPVAGGTDPERQEIFLTWRLRLGGLEALHAATGRPVLLTEIGYRSVDGAGRRPYDYSLAGPVDLEEQADLYGAALQATRKPWIDGLIWWNWLASGGGGPADTDYTPRGKPAAAELAAAWGAFAL